MALPTPVVVPEENEFFWFMGRAWDRFGNLYDLLVFSSLLLSLECVAMAYVSCFIQQVPWNALSAIIPFLVAFSIYNLNRKTDEDEDAINRQDRFAFTKRYEIPLYYGAVLSLGAALALSAMHGIPSLMATAAPFLLGILYSFRWLPKWFGYRRLKEIPAVKNIVVACAWAILLSLLPVFLNHGMPDSRTAITFLLFFMWGFMASLIPDIRDRAGDARASVRTIPVIFGEERTKVLLSRVLLLIGVPLVLFSLLFLPPFTTVLLVAANLYSHGCVYLLGRIRMRDFVADAISDGQYICFAFAIFVITSMYPWF
jgi:4-hydroxybenzoate polyprenyltransferase